MSMAVLILMLLAGGLLAWQAERLSADLPRWVSLATVTAALLYLLLVMPFDQVAPLLDPRDALSLIHISEPTRPY